MKKFDLKSLIITDAVCLFPIIIGLIFFPYMPESVPMHFVFDGTPDAFLPKAVSVFLMPLILLVLQSFLLIFSYYQDKNPQANKKINNVTKWILPVISIVVTFLIDFYAIGINLDIRICACGIVGLLFIIIGNYLPKSRSIKTQLFTKKYDKETKEKVYVKNMKVNGYVMIVMGFLFLISIFCAPFVSVIVLIVTLISILVTGFLYPFYLYKTFKGDM